MAKKLRKSKPTKSQTLPPAIPTTRPCWVGFDLGGTKMMACILDENYQVLGTARKSSQGSQGALKGVQRIAATIREALAAAGLTEEGIQGIGVGCPGTVNAAKGILISAPNLGWNRVLLGPALQRTFKKPVLLLNDVDAGTYGEYALGAGKGARSLLGVFPGTGLGAGFVYDGKLVQGRNISCMELGNIYLPGTHLNSAVPGAVLLEDLTSRLGIAAAAGVGCYRGGAPQLDAKTGAALREMKSKALTGSYKDNEPATVEVFHNSIQYLGMGVAMVINLLAPDHITLGGGLVEEMPREYIAALRQQVARYVMPELFTGVKFSVAKLGGNAVAIGSVAWLRRS